MDAFGGADAEGSRDWKEVCGGLWRLRQNVNFQGTKTPESGGVLILPHKSGVRYRLNVIFKSVRPNQISKNNEQREMGSSEKWGCLYTISKQDLLNRAES